MAQHYLAYLTATDSRSHAADYLNLTNMVRYHPGVEKIVLFIAISRVSSERRDDPRAVACLLREVQKCPWLELRSVFWKSNIGRDFSSAAVCLNAMRDSAAAEDFVMVRNRSAYGPFEDSWYAKYVVQYERFANTGLVGSTINFLGHPLRPTPNPATHVQTYVYLSQWKHLEPFLTDYPGARCAERLDLIEQGEIGLSQSIMKRGLGLSCLQWPNACLPQSSPGHLNCPPKISSRWSKACRSLIARIDTFGSPARCSLYANGSFTVTAGVGCVRSRCHF